MTRSGRRMVALATNPIEGASTRFRVEQWRDCLGAEGIDLRIEPFYPSEATGTLYGRGHLAGKVRHLTVGTVRRVGLLGRLASVADILFIHREAFPLGWPVLLDRVRRFPGPVIYDYDDALFVPQRRGRGMLEWMERVDTPARLMRLSDVVLAGNPFLADYARRHAASVTLLPTCIDTDRFRPAGAPRRDGTCVVGWIGSHTTAKYLRSLVPALERAAGQVHLDLYVVGCASPIEAGRMRVDQAPWLLAREVEDFQRCDIGVYPLWDDEWSQGKSGFKAIQFMACGVPVIAAPVGVTRDIIVPGVNGFLAGTPDAWVAHLVRLASDAALRRRIGEAGRRTVEERYSVRAQVPTFMGALHEAIERAQFRHAVRQPGARPVRL